MIKWRIGELFSGFFDLAPIVSDATPRLRLVRAAGAVDVLLFFFGGASGTYAPGLKSESESTSEKQHRLVSAPRNSGRTDRCTTHPTVLLWIGCYLCEQFNWGQIGVAAELRQQY